MSKFNYTLPSGSEFTVTAPTDATQEQSDFVFYSQVAAGSLIGYQSGQSLIGLSVNAKTFSLSRLERGTAGVGPTNIDPATVVNIAQNLPIIPSMPALNNTTVRNPITQADVVLARGDGLGPTSVGPLDQFAVQSLQAQATNIVQQPYYEITQEKGLGKFGMTCYQLEKAGYIKPTTSARFIEQTPDQFIPVMNSKTIWTGKGGVNSLEDILNDEQLQNQVYNDLMTVGYTGLQASGAITQTPTNPTTTMTSWVYTTGSLTTTGLTTPTAYSTITSGVSNALDGNVSQTSYQYSVTQTAMENQVNGDVGALVVNSAQFGPELATVWASRGELNATSVLATGQGTIQPTYSTTNPITATVSNYSNFDVNGLMSLPTNLTGQLNNTVSQLTPTMDVFGKAGQYATNFADLGTNFKDFASIDKLGDIASAGLTNQVNALSSQFNNITTNLSNQFTSATNSLQSGLDSLSKIDIGSFDGVSKLADKLLSSGSLSALSGKLGDLGKLFGQGNPLVSGIKAGAGFSGTIDRQTVDGAVDRIIGSGKITTPTFGFESNSSGGFLADITAAKNSLQDLGGKLSSAANPLLGSGASSTGLGGAAWNKIF